MLSPLLINESEWNAIFSGKQSQLWLSVSPSFVPLDCSSRRLFIRHYARDSLTRRLMAEKCKFEHVNLVGVSRQIPPTNSRFLSVFGWLFHELKSKHSTVLIVWPLNCVFAWEPEMLSAGFSAFSIINRRRIYHQTLLGLCEFATFRDLISNRRQRYLGKEFFGVFWEARKALKD